MVNIFLVNDIAKHQGIGPELVFFSQGSLIEGDFGYCQIFTCNTALFLVME